MPWWPRAPNFLTSSPSSSNTPNSYRYGSRALTRQRKLRHLRDCDIVGFRKSTGQAEPETLYKSVSVDDFFPSSRQSFAGPQPLPLPESWMLSRHDGYANSNPGDLPLPSPKESPGRGGDDRDRMDALIGDGTTMMTSEEGSLHAWIGSGIGYQDEVKGLDHVEKRASKKVFHDRNGIEITRENYRLNVPFRSAPSSPYSSPLLSPQGTRGDLFLSHYMSSQGQQVWSEPEMPISNIYLGYPTTPISPERTRLSSDTSPFYSPTVRSPPRHGEINENANVHPLPLPPGVSITQVVKSELLSMNSQWQKGKLIGRGTFGSVYMATNLETGALCAMKEVELCPDDPKSVECMKQLEQEIKVLSQLKHPNIVQYYGSEIVDDKFCIYLEYVHPGSINKYVNEHCEAITESVIRNFTRHILCGLAYLHSTKTIHRDIKGANLLVDASGVVKLADFGMAKHLTNQAANLSMKGSPYWMAPELMQSVMQKDTRSDSALAVDIWSLGCTIIEMLNGKPPWSEYEGAAAMFKVMRESPPIPESLSSEGKDFLRCCFRRNPAERPSASTLLTHRFVKNSSHSDLKSSPQSFNPMKLQIFLAG